MTEQKDRNESASQSGEEALDLSDLDEKGVGGIVAEYEGGFDGRRGSRRSGITSLLVAALTVPLLISMYPDFRYAWQPSEPTNLGTAAEFVTEHGVPSGYYERHVTLEGTPDVRTIAVARGPEETVRFIRLMESDGQLMAVVRAPRNEDPTGQVATYPGHFSGRMTRLGSLGRRSIIPWSSAQQFRWLSDFYELEHVTQTVDSSIDHLLTALDVPGEPWVIETEQGPVTLDRHEGLVHLSVVEGDTLISLGGDSFGPNAAKAAMNALGVPYTFESEADYGRPATGDEAFKPARPRHRIIARLDPDMSIDRVRAQLETFRQDDGRSEDIRAGVHVMPRSTTFVVAPNEITRSGDVLQIARAPIKPRYQVEGRALVPMDEGAHRLAEVPTDEVLEVRVEKPVQLDPNGYVIIDGERPGDRRHFGLMWVVIAAIAIVNVVMAGLWLRTQWATRGPADDIA